MGKSPAPLTVLATTVLDGVVVVGVAYGPAARAGVTQAGATALALVPVIAGLDITLAQWALVQGAIAMRIATLAGAARWWPPLHLLFASAIVWAHGLQIAPLWWALSLGACLGGNGTLVGASANLTVAGLAERAGVQFRFLTYTKLAFPLMLGSVAIAHVYLYFMYLR